MVTVCDTGLIGYILLKIWVSINIEMDGLSLAFIFTSQG